LVDICGNELPRNLQKFTQIGLTEVKIFQTVLRGATFFKHPVYWSYWHTRSIARPLRQQS